MILPKNFGFLFIKKDIRFNIEITCSNSYWTYFPFYPVKVCTLLVVKFVKLRTSLRVELLKSP